MVIFIAFVPLLLIEKYFFDRQMKYWRQKAWLANFISLLIWNVGTTFWMVFAEPYAASATFVANALLMTIPFGLHRFVKKHKGTHWGYFSLIVFWLVFEYMHLRWDLAWPWLTLGNAFANRSWLIQWYEWTGVLGGTLWILAINVLFTEAICCKQHKKRKAIKTALLFFIPFLISLGILGIRSWQLPAPTHYVTVVQPNINPYTEKFSRQGGEANPNFIPHQDQIKRHIALSKAHLHDSTVLVLWPETAMAKGYWEDKIEHYSDFDTITSMLTDYPNIGLIAGANTYRSFTEPFPDSLTALRQFGNSTFYEAYNTAIFFKKDTPLEIYHKSKLVPLVEAIPFPSLLKSFSLDLGGLTGANGKDIHRKVFSVNDRLKVAPIICYESVYGDYVTDYIKAGANLLCISTNDGWWRNTQGHRQHYSYAKLRAIECRRWVARSANTGISGFIDPLGHVKGNSMQWDTMGSSEHKIAILEGKTLYVLLGDWIGFLACFAMPVLLVLALLQRFKNKKSNA